MAVLFYTPTESIRELQLLHAFTSVCYQFNFSHFSACVVSVTALIHIFLITNHEHFFICLLNKLCVFFISLICVQYWLCVISLYYWVVIFYVSCILILCQVEILPVCGLLVHFLNTAFGCAVVSFEEVLIDQLFFLMVLALCVLSNLHLPSNHRSYSPVFSSEKFTILTFM